MNKFLNTLLVFTFTVILNSCNNNKVQTENNKVDKNYEIVKTTKYTSGLSQRDFKKNDREGTQFNIDKKTLVETTKSYTIKISDKEVLIYDELDSLKHKYLVQKRWIDKSGPSDVFDLTDGSIEGSLEHYISKSTDGKHYLNFRFKKVLENYSN